TLAPIFSDTVCREPAQLPQNTAVVPLHASAPVVAQPLRWKKCGGFGGTLAGVARLSFPTPPKNCEVAPMLPINTILHPTDFSERSGYAFHAACALARDYGAKLLVLHVREPVMLAFGEMPPFPAEIPDTRDAVLAKLHAIRPPDPLVSVEYLLR